MEKIQIKETKWTLKNRVICLSLDRAMAFNKNISNLVEASEDYQIQEEILLVLLWFSKVYLVMSLPSLQTQAVYYLLQQVLQLSLYLRQTLEQYYWVRNQTS